MARLAQVLLEGLARGESPGELAVLEDYRRRQAADQRNTIAFSDILPTVFGSDNSATVALRNAGLMALDLVGPARRAFAGFGAGLYPPGVRFRD